MKIAAAVRGVGWTLAALTTLIGVYAVLDHDADEAFAIIRVTALFLALILGITHTAAWFIERHAERVVVR